MLVSIYIRKADEDKWRKLPNKTEAVSKLLNGTQLSAVRVEEEIDASPIIKTKEDALRAVEPLWRNKKKGIL